MRLFTIGACCLDSLTSRLTATRRYGDSAVAAGDKSAEVAAADIPAWESSRARGILSLSIGSGRSSSVVLLLLLTSLVRRLLGRWEFDFGAGDVIDDAPLSESMLEAVERVRMRRMLALVTTGSSSSSIIGGSVSWELSVLCRRRRCCRRRGDRALMGEERTGLRGRRYGPL